MWLGPHKERSDESLGRISIIFWTLKNPEYLEMHLISCFSGVEFVFAPYLPNVLEILVIISSFFTVQYTKHVYT